MEERGKMSDPRDVYDTLLVLVEDRDEREDKEEDEDDE
jgi:hypothetical protein